MLYSNIITFNLIYKWIWSNLKQHIFVNILLTHVPAWRSQNTYYDAMIVHPRVRLLFPYTFFCESVWAEQNMALSSLPHNSLFCWLLFPLLSYHLFPSAICYHQRHDRDRSAVVRASKMMMMIICNEKMHIHTHIHSACASVRCCCSWQW